MMSGKIGRTVVTCASVALVAFGTCMTACGGDDSATPVDTDGGADATKDTSVPVQDSSIDTSVGPHDGGPDGAADTSANDSGSDAEDAADSGLKCIFPQLDCNAACVSTDTDIANCGQCGHACGTGNTCSAGHCSNAVSKVAAGERFACAVKFDGTVWCWGSNDMGELGVAPSAADQTCGAAHCNKTPTQIAGLTSVASVSTANDYACAVKKDGSVWCWGKNEYGELGHASGTAGDVTCTRTDADAGGAIVPCNPAPSQVAFSAGIAIAAISAGDDVVCGRTVPAAADAGADGGDAGVQGGDVYCWGDNVHDTVGLFAAVGPDAAIDPTHQPTPTPNKVSVFASDVVDLHVALGSHHACAVRAAGTVWCWGDDLQGRLGTLPGTDVDCAGNVCAPKPVQVKVQTVVDAGGDPSGDIVVGAALTTVKAVRAGGGASCALKNDGTVWCWGNDAFAALADKGPYSAAYAHPGARQILSIPAAKQIAQHGVTAFAIDNTGSAFGWGDNTFGELGTGTLTGVQCPAALDAGTCTSPPLLGVPHLREISAGLHLVVGIRSDDSVWAWGKNGHAQLGHAPLAGGDKSCAGPFETAPCNGTPSEVVIP